MLDFSTERLVSLSEAAAALPRRRGGKKPHVATLYRWAQRGCRGIVLETCQVGGTRCTSLEALQRFINRLSSPAGTVGGAPVHRRATDASVARELDDAGL